MTDMTRTRAFFLYLSMMGADYLGNDAMLHVNYAIVLLDQRPLVSAVKMTPTDKDVSNLNTVLTNAASNASLKH